VQEWQHTRTGAPADYIDERNNDLDLTDLMQDEQELEVMEQEFG